MIRRLIAVSLVLFMAGCSGMCGSRNEDGKRQRDLLNEKLRQQNRPTMGYMDVDRTIALTALDLGLDLVEANQRQADAMERLVAICGESR